MKAKNPYSTESVARSRVGDLATSEPIWQIRADTVRENANDELLLNERDVARRQGRSVRTLQNQRLSGGGIAYLKLGRSVRYRLSDVLAWEEARRRSSTSDEGSDA